MPHLFLVPLGVYFGPFCPGLLEVCDEKNVLSGSTGGDRTVCYVGREAENHGNFSYEFLRCLKVFGVNNHPLRT